MKHDDTCTEVCRFCGRPHDVFGHVHVVTHDDHPIVMCLVCIAGLAWSTRAARRNYMQGGHAFDKWGREHSRQMREKQGAGGGTEVPDILRKQLAELFENMQEDDDD